MKTQNLLFLTIIFSFFLAIGCETSQKPSEKGSQAPMTAEPASEQTAAPAEQAKTKEVVVTEQDVFEVEKLIAELNRLIARRDFESWKSYLTDAYIDYYSSPEILDGINQQPLLKANNVKLETLKDYFMFVVVSSRSEANLDGGLDYDNQTETYKAYAVLRGKKLLIYYLMHEGEEWKVTVSPRLVARQREQAA